MVWPLAAYALVIAAARAKLGREIITPRDRARGPARRRAGRDRARRDQPASGEAAFGTQPKQQPTTVDHRRAREPGRGRQAVSPLQIPWRGWKDILWRSYAEIGNDRLLAIAAGVVFYGLLALFPAITAFVSLYGLFADWSTINSHIATAAGFLPAGTVEIFQEQVTRIVSQGETTLGFAFLFGLGLALWSANAGMKAILDALNVIYDETEQRGFIKLTLISLALTGGAIAALLLALGSVIVLPILFQTVGLGSINETVLKVLRWPLLLVMVIVGLAVLYRYGPSRDRAQWQWLSVGGVVAGVLWVAASLLLSWYLENFANYNETYGSLGAAIGMMMWMWVSAIIILFGAELNSEIEHQTARDTTTGREEPLGQRGAAMADTVGASQE